MEVEFEFTVRVEAEVTPARNPTPSCDHDSPEFSDSGESGEVLDIKMKIDGLPRTVSESLVELISENEEVANHLIELAGREET